MERIMLIALFGVLSACGGGDDYDYGDNNCSSCFSQEDYFGNPGLVCTDDVPFGTTCFGGLRQFNEDETSETFQAH